MAFYNTCPSACRCAPSTSNGWMGLTVTGAQASEHPLKAGAALPNGGATVLALPSLQKIQDMLDRRSGCGELHIKQLGNFGLNCWGLGACYMFLGGLERVKKVKRWWPTGRPGHLKLFSNAF